MNLNDVTVLDLSRVLAGPYSTALLADLGAHVVKVEAPDTGDDARHFGPFRNGESLYFSSLNRGKQSVCLDLKSPAGQSVLHDLAGHADVLVENFRPGVTQRLGADYATLSGINPRLIYASITGYGQDGPDAQRPAYDLIVQAASGLMSITGEPDGNPTRTGESIADVTAGLFASWSICAALYTRERTGVGEHLDIAMVDALISMQVTALSVLAASGRAPGRVGNRHPVSAPFDTFATNDGMVVLVAANSAMFSRLAALIGQPEIADDPRFATDDARSRNEPELKLLIEQWTSERSTADAVAAANRVGVAATSIHNLAEAIDTPQARHRHVVARMRHPLAGEIPFSPQPVHSSASQPTLAIPSPALGEHTRTILTEFLNYDEGEMDRLAAAGAFGPNQVDTLV